MAYRTHPAPRADAEEQRFPWLLMTACLVLCLMLTLTPINQMMPFRWVGTGLSYLGVFFHEIGHAAIAWLYGYPSVPTFDFTHGGGMAYWGERRLALQILMLPALAFACVASFYRARVVFACTVSLSVLILLTSFTDFHEVFLYGAGHAAELAIGGFCLYRAVSNTAARRAGERTMNFIVGFFFPLHMMHMAWGLMRDDNARMDYFAQKGGHGFGDMSRIADYFSAPDEGGVACVFLIMAALSLIIPLLIAARQRIIHAHDADTV